jgi:pyruvate/2-oxoglutarate dehydrogenase complex dihydrolipoamide acyltransferase (E2) component
MYSRNSEYKEGKITLRWIENGKFRNGIYFLMSAVIVVSLALCACTTNGAVQPAANNPATTPAVTPAPAAPVIPVTPAQPTPTTPTPTPTPAPTPIVTVTPPAQPVPTVSAPAAENLIRREANTMTLTLNDMGPGWLKGNSVQASKGEVSSSSSVHYYKGTSFSPVVQNTVAVYRSMSSAMSAYAKEEANQATVTHPSFGNECFLNDSVAINKVLVFRKENVVVWIWLQQDKKGDIEQYANILAPRIVQ